MLLHTTTATILSWFSVLSRLFIAIVSMNFLGKTWQKIRGKSKENLCDTQEKKEIYLCDRCQAIIDSDTIKRKQSDSDNDYSDVNILQQSFKNVIVSEFNNSDDSISFTDDDDDEDDSGHNKDNGDNNDELSKTNGHKKNIQKFNDQTSETDHYQYKNIDQCNDMIFRKNSVSMLAKKFEAKENYNPCKTTTARTIKTRLSRYTPVITSGLSSFMIENISSKYFSKQNTNDDDNKHNYLITTTTTADNHNSNKDDEDNNDTESTLSSQFDNASTIDDQYIDTTITNNNDKSISNNNTNSDNELCNNLITDNNDNNNNCRDNNDIDDYNTVTYRKKNYRNIYVNSVDEILEQNRFSKRLSDYSLSDFMMDLNDNDDVEVTTMFNRI